MIKANVEDAYNSKKHKYIIIPYCSKIEQLIKDNYKIATGNDLIIKSEETIKKLKHLGFVWSVPTKEYLLMIKNF